MPLFALADGACVWRVWDGDVVLYDRQTGDTHAVRSPGGLALQALADSGPRSFAGLAAACALSSEADLRLLAEAIDLLVDLGILNRY